MFYIKKSKPLTLTTEKFIIFLNLSTRKQQFDVMYLQNEAMPLVGVSNKGSGKSRHFMSNLNPVT